MKRPLVSVLAMIGLIGLFGLFVLPTALQATGPFYVTGAIANASTDLDVEADFQRLIDDDDEGWSLGIGFHISKNLAVEGLYQDFGTAFEPSGCTPDMFCVASLVAPAKADSTAFSVSVLPHWPITESFAVYGRVGIASWESDVSEAFSDFQLRSVDDEDLIYGAGVRLTIAGPFGAFAELSRVADSFETVALGGTWGF
ncbi:MAG: outer membrane beta-barrel protein [Thermoanaerobaculia bacterium]